MQQTLYSHGNPLTIPGSYMPPRLSSFDIADARNGYAVLRSYSAHGTAVSSDLLNIPDRELCFCVSLSMRGPALGIAIFYVCNLRSSRQMLRVHAAWIVAIMQYA
jgi:hypothetical protein